MLRPIRRRASWSSSSLESLSPGSCVLGPKGAKRCVSADGSARRSTGEVATGCGSMARRAGRSARRGEQVHRPNLSRSQGLDAGAHLRSMFSNRRSVVVESTTARRTRAVSHSGLPTCCSLRLCTPRRSPKEVWSRQHGRLPMCNARVPTAGDCPWRQDGLPHHVARDSQQVGDCSR